MDRRKFVKSAGIMAAFSSFDLTDLKASSSDASKQISIIRTQSDFEREKLIRSFGFKGVT